MSEKKLNTDETYCEGASRWKEPVSTQEKQKHEEIKRMAREIYLDSCWERAEEFYNYAKEKEEANEKI